LFIVRNVVFKTFKSISELILFTEKALLLAIFKIFGTIF